MTVDRENDEANVDGAAAVTALVEAVEDAGYTAHACVELPAESTGRFETTANRRL